MSNNKVQPVRGTKDLLPDEYKKHQRVIDVASKIATKYDYDPLAVPIFEFTKVFDRTLGETSDVVSKEMYSFLDRSGESLTLRPEFTASVVRSLISNGLSHELPLKFFSYGPVFRYDRPQAGRQRQFHQLNFEYLGANHPFNDAEVIKMAADILADLGLWEDVSLEINSVGCVESRQRYQKALTNYFSAYKDQLSEDSLKRLEKNPMRILDSKVAVDQEIAVGAPKIGDSYTQGAADYFEQVLKYLDDYNIPYKINSNLVRGLDYYTHTAFEFVTDKLGSQSAVGGGGRYDGLVKLMGGPDTPAIGFGFGVERLALLSGYNHVGERPIYVLPLDDAQIALSAKVANDLRDCGFRVNVACSGRIIKRMQKANNNNAVAVIFIGSEEAKLKQVKIKNLDLGKEELIPWDQIVNYIQCNF